MTAPRPEEMGKLLPDDYPVYFNYCYIMEPLDGLPEIILSDIEGDVQDLKHDIEQQRKIKVKNIRSYIFRFGGESKNSAQ